MNKKYSLQINKRINIGNRRYTGCKVKLLDWLYDIVDSNIDCMNYSMADIFGGTGVVADYFLKKGHDIIVNDTLYSNYVAYEAWFSNCVFDINKVNGYMQRYNSIDGYSLRDNYFSKIYGDKYFSQSDARKIGYIRDNLEDIKTSLTNKEYYILLASLIYEADRIANTVGHFEHYLSSKPKDHDVALRELELLPNSNRVKIFNEDANLLIKKIAADVIYIDPPYNARQYINFYHVLENLARWEKPSEFEGKSMKFKRDWLKSGYSRVGASDLMRDLVAACDCKIIAVSYNNTYNARSGASNNRIQEDELYNILSNRGIVKVYETRHQFFNTGKTNFKNHKEKLYICKI